MWLILKCYALPGASHGWPMIGRSLDEVLTGNHFLIFFCLWTIFSFFFNFAGWLTTQFLFLMNISKFAPAKTMVIHPVFGWSTLSTPILHDDFSIKNPPHIDISVNLCQIFFKSPFKKRNLTQLDHLSPPRSSFAGHWPWNATHGHTRPVLVPDHRQPVLQRIEMRISQNSVSEIL